MTLKTIKARMSFNKNAYGSPKLDASDDRYFVRACIAHYLSEGDEELYASLLDDDDILPEKYAPAYSSKKEAYDKLGDVSKDSRYEDVIKKFSYLYEAPLHGRKITVGYNVTGQEFFDAIAPYSNVIEEFFFSFTHTMAQFPLDYQAVYESLKGTHQYDIPANLLLNLASDNDTWEKQLEDAMKVTHLQAVSVMSEEMGHKVKAKYPHLRIHISTHGVDSLDPDNLDAKLIDTVNIDEPEMYGSQKKIVDACLAAGIKIKFITNRDCILGRYHTLSQFAGKKIKCCQGTHAPCFEARVDRPWLAFATTTLYKEQALDSYATYFKLSTRELNNKLIKQQLDYWTNCQPTQMVGLDIRITEERYPIFLEWIQLRKTCSGHCYTCRRCKSIYEKMMRIKEGE